MIPDVGKFKDSEKAKPFDSQIRNNQVTFWTCALCVSKLRTPSLACYECAPEMFHAELSRFEKARQYYAKNRDAFEQFETWPDKCSVKAHRLRERLEQRITFILWHEKARKAVEK